MNRLEPTRELRASVVIPVRERTTDLEKCLEQVRHQKLSMGEFEIIVCDDGSSASSAERIQEICSRDQRIRYQSQAPLGPAAARNLGIRHARAAIVVFTDSDTLPQPGWLERILEPFADPAVAAVEGPVRTPGPAQSPLEEAPRNEGGVHLTANMAYRVSALRAAGGLDEAFPYPAFEDVDLALRVRPYGSIVFAPRALVLHPWRRVTLASSLKRLRQLDWLIVIAQRHGCLGWIDRPTHTPKWRVIRAALLTLPLGRLWKGIKALPVKPRDAVTRIGISFVEMAAAWIHLLRWGQVSAPPVRDYLSGIPS